MDEITIQRVREAIEKFPPYPDLYALEGSGDLRKVRGGYEVLTQKGFDSISRYIASVLKPFDESKPAVFKLHRRKARKL